jgi:hypothetical protein
MKIKQYFPAFFEGFDGRVDEFFITQALRNIPWINNFIMSHGENLPFDGFAYSGNKLMVTYGNNAVWYVIGWIDEDTLKTIHIPEWVSPVH